MIGEKPKKSIYKNQKEIKRVIVSHINNKLSRHFSKIYVIGSLSKGEFGVYEEKHEGYFGSDIDLAVIPKQNMKPFRYKGEFHDWHEYFGGTINIAGTKHPINLMIPIRQDMSLLFKKAKELKWRVERLK